jgi:HSP20 family protein
MATLTTSGKSLFPSWTNELFEKSPIYNRIRDFGRDFPSLDFTIRIPSTNIHETEKEFQIEMAAPGLEKKDFKVKLEKNTLTISSEKEEENKKEEKNYSLREYAYNSFSRSFALPDNCLPDKINARYENGVLYITLPKKEVSVSTPIKEITVS